LKTLDQVEKDTPNLTELVSEELKQKPNDAFTHEFASQLIDGVLTKIRPGEQLPNPEDSSPSPQSVSTSGVIKRFLASNRQSV
jgi:hypothetical protein